MPTNTNTFIGHRKGHHGLVQVCIMPTNTLVIEDGPRPAATGVAWAVPPQRQAGSRSAAFLAQVPSCTTVAAHLAALYALQACMHAAPCQAFWQTACRVHAEPSEQPHDARALLSGSKIAIGRRI